MDLICTSDRHHGSDLHYGSDRHLSPTAGLQPERLNRKRSSQVRLSGKFMPKFATAGGLCFSGKSLAGDGISSGGRRRVALHLRGVILSHLIEITTCLDAKTGTRFQWFRSGTEAAIWD